MQSDVADPAISPSREVTNFVVAGVEEVAQGVRLLRLEPFDGGDVAAWEPGAHIDLVLPSGRERQYSLCGDPADRRAYTVGVLRSDEGRGGSIEVHALEHRTSVVGVRGPRNNFALVPADDYLFIAGGIGITPIFSMIERLRRSGHERWRLLYGGRSLRSMAFAAHLGAHDGRLVQVVPKDESGRMDVARAVAEAVPGTRVYACGPDGLLESVEKMCCERSDLTVHVERFGAASSVPLETGGPFEVELRRSGQVISVSGDRSLLDAVLDVVPDAPYGCMEGYCGGCETRVIEGIPDHHDDVLNDAERAENDTMMICVGRAKTSRLVLDL